MGSSNNKQSNKPFRRVDIGQFSISICTTLGVLACLYAYIYNRNINEVFLGPTIALGIFSSQRLLLFLQELVVNRSRPNNDWAFIWRQITGSSDFTKEGRNDFGFWFRLVCFIIGGLMHPPVETWFKNKVDILIFVITIIIGIHFQWYNCALLESYRLEKPFSYSGGSAMAFSLYYGYLKLITPGLLDRINKFKDNEGVYPEQIPHKKLFILIPSSSFVFDKLEGYQQYTKTQDLKVDPVEDKFQHHEQDRGLVKRRTYKNTMYIVEYSETEKYYILLEGATPIKTFYETCKEHNEFESNKNEVISSFYYTLKHLIRENKEMKDIVKLIYYDDLTTDVTIPEIIRERILKRYTNKDSKKKKTKKAL